MNQSKITVRYAKAFFALAKEKDQMDLLSRDMTKVYNLCNESPDFLLLLESPVIKTSRKTELIRQIFQPHVTELTLRFLILIAENKREVHLPGICRDFLDFVRKEQGISTAVVTTATRLSAATLEKIREQLAKESGVRIELTEKVNPAIIGGMILRIDDRQLDASVATQLKKIKSRLLETEINK